MRTRLETALAATAAVAALTVAGCSAPDVDGSAAGGDDSVTLSADYPVYDSLEAAGDEADSVVRGVYISSEVDLLYPMVDAGGDAETNPQDGVDVSQEDLDEMAVVITVSRVEVTEVLKGDLQVGDVIEVSQLGGRYDDVQYDEESTTLLEQVAATEVVVLLNDTGAGRFDLINPAQGLFEVEGDSVTAVEPDSGLGDVATLDAIRELVAEPS